MDEKTEELREIFLDVADDDTVTEHQDDDRGSLESDRDIETELQEVLKEMRDRYEFRTDFTNKRLIDLVKGFYEGNSDEELADSFDVATDTIREARLDLHLVRSAERDAPFDVTAASRAHTDGATIDDLCERYDVSPSLMREKLRIHEVDQRSRQVNQRFRDAFDSILADMELTTRMVSDVHEDGLEDATDGLETNVSF